MISVWEEHFTEGTVRGSIITWDCKYCTGSFTPDATGTEHLYYQNERRLLHSHLVECHLDELIKRHWTDNRSKFEKESKKRMIEVVKVIEDIIDDHLPSLSVELWRDPKLLPNMRVRFIYIDKNMLQKSIILSKKRLQRDLKGSDMYNHIHSVANQFGVAWRVVACTYQANEIVTLLKDYLDSDASLNSKSTKEDPNFTFIECIGTYLHNTLQRFLDSQGEIFPKLLAILYVLFNDSMEIKDRFQKMVDEHFQWKIAYEESWSSQFMMLTMIYEERERVKSLVTRTEVGRIEEGSGRYVFDTTEIGKIQGLTGFMKNIDNIISELMLTTGLEKRDLTIGMWLHTMIKIEEEATQYLEQDDDADEFGGTVKSLKDAITNFLDSMGEKLVVYLSAPVDIRVRDP